MVYNSSVRKKKSGNLNGNAKYDVIMALIIHIIKSVILKQHFYNSQRIIRNFALFICRFVSYSNAHHLKICCGFY